MAKNDVAEFVGVTPHDMIWAPIPNDPDILTVTLVGDPNKPGPFVARYKIPPNMQIVPHTHRVARSYTVLNGVWNLGLGKTFDDGSLQSFPKGSFYRLPARVPHFQKAGPEGAVIQVESIGPFTFDLLE